MMTTSEPAVPEASWRLTITDIANGGGIAQVTLRSGVQFTGQVDKTLSQNEVLFLRTRSTTTMAGWNNVKHIKGWVCIDWTEIAAIAGEPKETMSHNDDSM